MTRASSHINANARLAFKLSSILQLAKSSKGRLEECFNEEIGALTIHGVPKIFSSSAKLLRAFWTVLCISAITFLVYFATASVKRHLQREVETKTERIQRTALNLPAITICNTNIFNLDSTANDSYPVEQELPTNCSFTSKKYFKNEVNRQYFMQFCRLFFANQSFPGNQHAARVGQYNVVPIKFPEHFSLLPQVWPCFTLNRNQLLKQYSGGSRSGFRAILYFDENDSSQYHPPDFLDAERRGLFVTIHDAREHVNGFEGIFLPAGFHTSIEISKYTIKRKQSPFPSHCVYTGQEAYENIFPGKPSISTCLFSCFSLTAYKRCGGVVSVMRSFMKPDRYPNILNITNPDAMACLHDNIRYMNECNCQLPCDEESYETKVSRTPWPPKWQHENLYGALHNSETENTTSSREFMRNLLKVSIYYKNLCEFVYTEEEKYGVMSILSDFGGQMGLFIGASILSFVEIVILLANCINSMHSKRSNVESLAL